MRRRYWIGTVSKEHVERGKAGGFAQVCHGKEGPLTRMKPQDILIYYSPQLKFGEKAPYQCFTAIGEVIDRIPYQAVMTEEFVPFRRDINYLKTDDAAIRPLIADLSFIKNKKSWGYCFRFGIMEINTEDFKIIAQAMNLAEEIINELLV